MSIALFGFSCKSVLPSVLPSVFKKGTLHEQYVDLLQKKGIDETAEGRRWLEASKAALYNSKSVKLPLKQSNAFKVDSQYAVGIRFKAVHGQRIEVDLNKDSTNNFVVYADLYKVVNDSTFSPVYSADTSALFFYADVNETAEYVLRMQRQIERKGKLKLALRTAPSLSFPVASNKASAQSFWGADRDGGKRKHEGIDIFAKKGTPVIAAADGYVTGVREGGIGGKTVWMRVTDKDIYLYYAHLDQQFVQDGQRVRLGDTLGLVGNTGNARFTPAHLHFGIYTYSGAIDPLPFVGKSMSSSN